MSIDYQKFGFLPYQVAWLEDRSQIKLYEKSRRVGITYAQAFEDVVDAGVMGLYDVWFSSNNETNAREYIDYCKKFAKALSLALEVAGGEVIIEDDGTNTFVLRFRNGKRITGLSSSPNQLHGKGGKIVLDEFARRDNEFEVWEAASPAALVWGYPIRIISTHKGKNSVFFSFIKRLERGELAWSHHKTTFTEAVRMGLAAKSLKKAKCTLKEQDAYIQKIKDSVGDSSIWAQQFMCEPCDENEVFIPQMLLESSPSAELMTIEQMKGCRELYGGIDVGRKRNYTLLWLTEKVSPSLFVTRYLMEIQGDAFPKQNAMLSEIIASLPNIRRICIDATGMGIGLSDYLQEQWGKSRIEAVSFTASSKEVMAFRLKKQLEEHGFALPHIREVFDDFGLVRVTLTATGNIRLTAETKEDSHADRFWAAALCLEAANGNYVPPAVHVAGTKTKRSSRIEKMLQGFTRE